ncbi:hypothetical protein [Rhodopseudomonas sp.]|uniref:hypothetical protein n=1 Tax=Rhodopseudomonas sp. TaxID=1078 RepID=UPI0039E52D42
MRLERLSWTEKLSGPKARRPIPILSPLFRDAVIQASLNPRVRKLSFVRTLCFRGVEVPADLLLLHGEDRVAMELLDARPLRGLDEIGMLLLALERSGSRLRQMSARDVEQEPLLSNCRLVWNSRDAEVHRADRHAIFAALGQGATKLGELRRSCGLGCETVHALMCADLIGADLSLPLNDDLAIVRIRRPAVPRAASPPR